MSAVTSAEWEYRGGRLPLEGCRVMAIVNVTPDSFSDGGRWADASGDTQLEMIVEQCRRWLAAGADVLDVGGESTRPGAEPVSHTQECARVLPVIEALATAFPGVPISIDTRHSPVAHRALLAGARIVNDVSGLADPYMAAVVAEANAGLIVGHMRGEPATMQRDIAFDDLFAEVAAELTLACDQARSAGVGAAQLLVDPCVGFGKTADQSAALVASSAYLTEQTGYPVLIGASRKRFLAELSGIELARERTLPSVASALSAATHGAAIVRVHDVCETLEALRVHTGIEAALARFQRPSDET